MTRLITPTAHPRSGLNSSTPSPPLPGGFSFGVPNLNLQMSELFMTDGPAIDYLSYGDDTGCIRLMYEAGVDHMVDDLTDYSYHSLMEWPE